MTMIRLETMSANATMVIRKMEPLLAGNLPRMIQYCVTNVSLSLHPEVCSLVSTQPPSHFDTQTNMSNPLLTHRPYSKTENDKHT